MVPFALYGEFKGWPCNVGTPRYGEEHKLNEIALISVADTLFDYCAGVLNYSTSEDRRVWFNVFVYLMFIFGLAVLRDSRLRACVCDTQLVYCIICLY